MNRVLFGVGVNSFGRVSKARSILRLLYEYSVFRGGYSVCIYDLYNHQQECKKSLESFLIKFISNLKKYQESDEKFNKQEMWAPTLGNV